ncbi:MAG: hypothetical protein LBE82_04300, partial [Chitinophagaceae bacterium]|nr:hypothetical protein [Chitinophagaceae bacterium]
MSTKFIFFVFLFFAAYNGYAAGSEPGNWRWRNNDGDASANIVDAKTNPSGTGASWRAPVNTGVQLGVGSTAVFRLRMQSNSGRLDGSGQLFLQYLDADSCALDVTGNPIIPTKGTFTSYWETNSITGTPQPIAAFRGVGQDGNDETLPYLNGSPTVNHWTTIGPRSGGAANAGTNTVFIMAGNDAFTKTDASTPQALASLPTYDAETALGRTNDFDLL